MKRIGVLTSGGDAPGMNAAIRGVVRTALVHGVETVGIHKGYSGLLTDDTEVLTSRSVGGIARWGGTILQTARCLEFKTPEGFQKAVDTIERLGIEGIVVIGGDGSLHGAQEIHMAGIPCVGLPGSIDNDIYGTDVSIGVDTAMNTIVEAIDKLKDTASAHQRAFVVEVMGRRSGYLALAAGIAGGAEMVIAPEHPVSMNEILDEMARARERGKPHFMLVVAEGATPKAVEICEACAANACRGFEARLTVLGHVQRGGSPTAFDRILATKLAYAAVNYLVNRHSGILIGIQAGKPSIMPLEDVLRQERPADQELLALAETVAL